MQAGLSDAKPKSSSERREPTPSPAQLSEPLTRIVLRSRFNAGSCVFRCFVSPTHKAKAFF